VKTDTTIVQAARILWEFHCIYDELKPASAIVGLGSYDLRVAEECAELYKLGLSSRIILTGASGNWTEGLFGMSEAAMFAQHAISCGVPNIAMTLEESATNIGENIELVSQLIPDADSVILVTKPQTQTRCKATAIKKWPSVRCMITAPRTTFENQPTSIHNERRLFCEMVGDLERLRTYPAFGFQIAVDIPEKVLCAFETLKDAGFTDHLPRKSSLR
jgi:uncharacterized SAM-binding protein YcdF (DUF218 family)